MWSLRIWLQVMVVVLSSSMEESEMVVGSATTTSTLIWLHGLGDRGKSWRQFAENIVQRLPHVKVILPTAPMRAITLNGGRKTRGWYDIYTLTSINEEEDSVGIHDTFQDVERLISQEAQKVRGHRYT